MFLFFALSDHRVRCTQSVTRFPDLQGMYAVSLLEIRFSPDTLPSEVFLRHDCTTDAAAPFLWWSEVFSAVNMCHMCETRHKIIFFKTDTKNGGCQGLKRLTLPRARFSCAFFFQNCYANWHCFLPSIISADPVWALLIFVSVTLLVSIEMAPIWVTICNICNRDPWYLWDQSQNCLLQDRLKWNGRCRGAEKNRPRDQKNANTVVAAARINCRMQLYYVLRTFPFFSSALWYCY